MTPPNETLVERGLDFDNAWAVFSGGSLTLLDDRRDYGEPRFQTYGLLGRRLVIVVWTPRGSDRHHHFDEEMQCHVSFRGAAAKRRRARNL